MGNHHATDKGDGKSLFLVFETLAAAGNPLDVGAGRLLQPFHSYRTAPLACLNVNRNDQPGRFWVDKIRTVISEGHFLLQHLELVRVASLGLGAHLLTGPLEGAVESLGEVHGCGIGLDGW